MLHDTSRARLLSRKVSGRTVLSVHGELDIATTSALRNRILAVLSETSTSVIIDLSGVSFCDASGLTLLVGARRRAMMYGLSITLAAPRPHMSKLLRITQLDRVFTVYATVAGALHGDRPEAHTAVA